MTDLARLRQQARTMLGLPGPPDPFWPDGRVDELAYLIASGRHKGYLRISYGEIHYAWPGVKIMISRQYVAIVIVLRRWRNIAAPSTGFKTLCRAFDGRFRVIYTR